MLQSLVQRDTYARTDIYVKKRETQSKKPEKMKNEDKYNIYVIIL